MNDATTFWTRCGAGVLTGGLVVVVLARRRARARDLVEESEDYEGENLVLLVPVTPDR